MKDVIRINDPLYMLEEGALRPSYVFLIEKLGEFYHVRKEDGSSEIVEKGRVFTFDALIEHIKLRKRTLDVILTNLERDRLNVLKMAS